MIYDLDLFIHVCDYDLLESDHMKKIFLESGQICVFFPQIITPILE